MNTLEDVKQFHKLFNHPVLETPQIPSAERCALRVNLISEELKELQDGIKNGDIVECADAFADLQYVLSGAILEFGLADKFPAIFAEVQRSNMSKACATHEEAYDTMTKYSKEGIPAHMSEQPINGRYIVVRASDNKILKSINYSPADLSFVKE